MKTCCVFLEMKSFKLSADDSEEQNSCVLFGQSTVKRTTQFNEQSQGLLFSCYWFHATQHALPSQQPSVAVFVCTGETHITVKKYTQVNQHFIAQENLSMIVLTIRTGIILLSFACCCYLRELRSSYFTLSFPKRSHEESEAISEFRAESELACALRCSSKGDCDEATFNRDSRECSLYQKEKDSTEPYEDDDNTPSRILNMRKVRNKFVKVL